MSGLLASGLVGDTTAVSVKLKAYVALVSAVGAALTVGLAATVDLDRLQQDLPAVGLFACFIVAGELLVVPIRHRGQVRELTDNALARADSMFAWDPSPWFGFIF